jgi:hypothetical protein
MNFKKVRILVFLLFPLIVLIPAADGKQNPVGHDLKTFRDLLANINASFILPDGFNEIKPIATDKFPCQYALQLPTADFEVRFQVNSLKQEWKNFEQGKGDKVNPDSLYSKLAVNEVKGLALEGKYFSRAMPERILEEYNADLGRSYFFNLADSPETNHYQYALLVVLQKNHYGSIVVVCFSNERGPGFFKNINKLKDCLRFTN